MNTISTATTRPRTSFGAATAGIVLRMLTLIMSTKPLTASAASERAKLCESPKTIIETPNAATTARSVVPGVPPDRLAGEHDRRRASAPTAGALRSTPRPSGPVWRICFAKSGSSAIAPPKRTANRSSEIAPSMTGVRLMNLIPSSTLESPGAFAPGTRSSGSLCRDERCDADREHDGREPVDRLLVEGEEEAAERGPDDGSGLERDRAPRHRARDQLERDERGAERACRRVRDRRGDAAGRREHEEGPELLCARDRDHEQERRRRRRRARARSRRRAGAGAGRRDARQGARAGAAAGTRRGRSGRGRTPSG